VDKNIGNPNNIAAWFMVPISDETLHYFGVDGHSLCGEYHSKIHKVNGKVPDIRHIPKCTICQSKAPKE